MLRLIDLSSGGHTKAELLQTVPRAALDAGAALEQVRPLIEAVRSQGVRALREQAARFDNSEGHELRVPEAVIKGAVAGLDADIRQALELMIERVGTASKAQIPATQVVEIAAGARITQRWQPVDRVGLYVPGGKAVYPSSVIMNAVPALTAGVRSLAIASPVQPEYGTVHPTILAAAALCGVEEIYAIGGAGAIGAFAYGVPELDLAPVDIITGPGNIFVASAKRAVSGVVGIDSEAGTTEIMVLADASADPALVAGDLISQAEHDEAAAAVLVSDDPQLIERVQAEIRAQVATAHHSGRIREALAGPQSAAILAKDLAHMVQIADAYAAEHLEIHTVNAASVAGQVSNAGAIFVGPHTPVSLGDYMAGSNHVLPTGGTARFAAGLGAHTFLRPQQIIDYSAQALRDVTDPLVVMATAEGLPAHGNAAVLRKQATNDEAKA